MYKHKTVTSAAIMKYNGNGCEYNVQMPTNGRKNLLLLMEDPRQIQMLQ